jgi:L-ascorbate metabolism protein UlaG (beta-lactamase superfamily)
VTAVTADTALESLRALPTDVRAKRMIPVHWSTFNLAYHDWDEPIRRALAEAKRTGVDLVTPRVGEWVDADRQFQSTRWWEGVR